MKIKLRSFQQEANDSAIEYLESDYNNPVAIVLPTAAGKSYCIAGIAEYHNGPVLVLQPSVDLLRQNFGKYTEDYGLPATMYSASAGTKELSEVTFGTLASVKKEVEELRKLKNLLVIIDECHYKFQEKPRSEFRTFVDRLKPKKVIGLTATPFKTVTGRKGIPSSVKLLNNLYPCYFRKLIHVTQIEELIRDGYWTPSKDELWNFNGEGLALNTTGHDFTAASIKKFQEVNGINNKVYLRIVSLFTNGERKNALVFLDSLEACGKMKAALEKRLDIKVGVVDSNTPAKDRKRIVDDFKGGKTQVMLNHGIFTTGFDYPALEAIIMGYPTNSLSLLYQMYGRGVRLHEGKKDFLFSDFCGNITRLGHPRTLEIKDHPEIGWQVYSGSELKSGYPQFQFLTITEEDVLLKLPTAGLEDIKFSFGKHKNRKFSWVVKRDPGYLAWIVKEQTMSEEILIQSELWLREHYFEELF